MDKIAINTIWQRGKILGEILKKVNFVEYNNKKEKIYKILLTFTCYFGIIILVQRTDEKVSKLEWESKWLIGQVVKTPPSHGGNRGSNPLWVII